MCHAQNFCKIQRVKPGQNVFIKGKLKSKQKLFHQFIPKEIYTKNHICVVISLISVKCLYVIWLICTINLSVRKTDPSMFSRECICI